MIGFELGHYALVRSVENALEQEVLISREMGEAMALWERLYKDRAPWKNEDVKSLNVAAQDGLTAIPSGFFRWRWTAAEKLYRRPLLNS